MNEYQKRNQDNAQELANQFTALNYPAKVVIGANSDDYIVVINGKYQARKWHDNQIIMSEYPYRHVKTVSTHKQSEIRKAINISNNMKVLTAKKIVTRLLEIDAINAEIARLEVENIEKQALFLRTLIDLPVRYTYKRDFNANYEMMNTEEITGGEIVRNGIEYIFELCQDGYISQKVKLHYSVNNTLASFIALSENKYSK